MHLLLPLVATILTAQVGPPGPVQAREAVGVHMKKFFLFDWNGLSRDGNPHAAPIEEIVFRYSIPGGEPKHWIILAIRVVPGETRVPFFDTLKGVPDGDWDLVIKLKDAEGEEGNYSAPPLELKLLVLKARPSTTTNLRTGDP